MVTPKVKLDPETSLGAVEKLRGPLEDQLTSALQVAVEEVAEDYDGESVTDVTEELRRTTKAGLHSDIADGFAPNETQLRSVAETIVRENQA